MQDLKNICVRLLKGFYRATGYKPERLIFYRDGVSEGSFAEVQRTEIPQVHAVEPSLRSPILCRALQQKLPWIGMATVMLAVGSTPLVGMIVTNFPAVDHAAMCSTERAVQCLILMF